MSSRCRRAYILPLWFFVLFSTPNLWGHWMKLHQIWTHIHLWLLFEEFGPNSPGHLPPQAVDKKCFFWDQLLTLTEHISATEHDINTWKETSIYRDFSTCPQCWWTLAENTASFTAWTLYNRQQANVGTCHVVARAYSLEQQNARRAHAGLCHAYS